jgi:hypothetical protein
MALGAGTLLWSSGEGDILSQTPFPLSCVSNAIFSPTILSPLPNPYFIFVKDYLAYSFYFFIFSFISKKLLVEFWGASQCETLQFTLHSK